MGQREAELTFPNTSYIIAQIINHYYKLNVVNQGKIFYALIYFNILFLFILSKKS